MKSNDVTSDEHDNEPKGANIPGPLAAETDLDMVNQLPHLEAFGKSMVSHLVILLLHLILISLLRQG